MYYVIVYYDKNKYNCLRSHNQILFHNENYNSCIEFLMSNDIYYTYCLDSQELYISQDMS